MIPTEGGATQGFGDFSDLPNLLGGSSSSSPGFQNLLQRQAMSQLLGGGGGGRQTGRPTPVEEDDEERRMALAIMRALQMISAGGGQGDPRVSFRSAGRA
jgi:hypothetical protein